MKKKTKVEKEEDANEDLIASALINVINDADLLRTIESERQFSKMQFLCVIMSMFVISLQQYENVDVGEDATNGHTSQWMAIKTESQIKKDILKWGPESYEMKSINGNKNIWLVYLLMTVHVLSWLIGRILIGTKRNPTKEMLEEFPKKFKILFVLLLALNIGTAVVCIPTNLINDRELGQYFHLWILADVLLLFAIQFNIYAEHIYVERYDQMIIQHVFDLVQN